MRRSKGGPAAAGRCRVGVVELEPGPADALDVIDDHAVQVDHAAGVDEDFDVAIFQYRVILAGAGFQAHLVFQAGAASSATWMRSP